MLIPKSGGVETDGDRSLSLAWSEALDKGKENHQTCFSTTAQGVNRHWVLNVMFP